MKVIGKKRRIENKTNYRKRKRLLEGEKPRIVIRKSNRYITIQYIESKIAQDKIKYGITSKELLEYGWEKSAEGRLKSLPASYLTGLLFGKRNLGKINEAVLDTGLIRSTRGSKIYAAAKGLIDSGIKIKCDAKMFPDEKRIINKNVQGFFDNVKNKIIGDRK